MPILSISNAISRLDPIIKKFQKKSSPPRKTYNSFGENKEDLPYGYLMRTDQRATFEAMRKYRYEDEMVFTGVNLLTQAILGNGNFIHPGKDFSKESALCHNIITNRDFKKVLKRITSDALAYGKGCMELVWTGDSITGYAYVAPQTIKPEWDQKGRITGYVQTTENNTKKVNLKPEELLYLSFYTIGDNAEGIGLIEPMIHRLYSKRSSQKASDEAMEKYANPSLHGTLQKGTRAELAEYHRDLMAFKRSSVLTTTSNGSLNIVGEKKNFPDFTPLIDNILDSIAGTLRVPKETLLPSGKNLNRSSLEYLIKQNEKELVQLQQDLSTIIESTIFTNACMRKKMYNIPDLGWNPLNIDNEKDRAEINNFKMNTLAVAVQNGLITRVEGADMAREAFKMNDLNV